MESLSVESQVLCEFHISKNEVYYILDITKYV